ncbi:MAG: glycosyltransferase [Sphingomonadaceae bacterium]
MAHVLLGWELGGGSGHALKLATLGERLRAAGHEVTLALRWVHVLDPERAGGSPIWQGPSYPPMRPQSARLPMPRSMGDILTRLGFQDVGVIAALLGAWQRILETLKPDVVVAEYAPLLLAAARGRIPAVATGTAFELPPANMDSFPSLDGGPPLFDEARTLTAVNTAFARAGVKEIGRLPEMFAAERSIAASFPELDYYAEARADPLADPSLPKPRPVPATDEGEEIFFYSSTPPRPDALLWAALERSKRKVRVHLPKMTEAYRTKLAVRGFAVEADPVPFADIAGRSRLIVSHGGMGTVSSALLAGRPQIVCPFDLEKLMQARAVDRLKVGGFMPMEAIDPDAFAKKVEAMYEDEDLARRARELAHAIAARPSVEIGEAVAGAVEELA